MTLWSDFLRRLMVTATLSNPAAAAGPRAEPPSGPPAEVGDPSPSAAAAAAVARRATLAPRQAAPEA